MTQVRRPQFLSQDRVDTLTVVLTSRAA